MNNTNKMKEKLKDISGLDAYTRIDNLHPLDLYVGYNQFEQVSVLIILPFSPKQLFSSSIIDVKLAIRPDNRFALTFSLKDNYYEDIFLHFFDDIIESSRVLNSEKGYVYVVERFKKWQNMLKRSKGDLLSSSEIKGLIAELYVLMEVMFPKYGVSKSIMSWIGSENTDQDFVLDNEWAEVKATTSGSNSVTISSIEQLDSDYPGKLIVVYLDKTSLTDTKSYSLNSIVDLIKIKLTSMEDHDLFANSLYQRKYFFHNGYDSHVYHFNGIRFFTVTNDFPCLRRVKVSKEIINANYDLSLSSLAEFEERGV